ncbi:hypothetical protein BDM02DRAFT_3185338 [Thelephora ganbajun]|uniref:Uncharacterized protein n=1 Tax=Thelephora ganbajun TaxID=370292 RepID=A0ACB6ZLF2_THEGA|nr:hypothetical protein BDM02DRAFT_3185338 [Thelephora ganbajun]
MPSFGHIIQHLRSLRIRSSKALAASPLVRRTSGQHIRRIQIPAADLSLVLAKFTEGFKGLPQEIVNEILEYLEDDLRTLKACSLTCKALLCSARHTIHRRLYVVGPGKAATPDERETRQYEAANRAELRTLSVAAKCGLAHYTRELTIKVGEEFTPQTLQPYLPQFQMFARLTSLTLYHFNPTPFLPVFNQYFGHLAQQIRSLKFIHPGGPQDDMTYFISQFPNLDDLGFNPLPRHNLRHSRKYTVSSIRSSPTLRGTLKVTSSTNAWGTNFLESLIQLPSGLRFRSIEFHCIGINPDIIIRECTSTLQSLTHVFRTYDPLLRFDLSACSHLRIFELRAEFTIHVFRDFVLWLISVINTITSPLFSRFVFVDDNPSSQCPFFRRADGDSVWRPLDQALLRLSQRTGMKMIGRRKVSHAAFCNSIEEAFPLMVSVGALELESL